MTDPVRVLYVAPDGRLIRARLVETPRADGAPTKLLLMRGKRMEVLTARQSDRREPGTWHREEAAS